MPGIYWKNHESWCFVVLRSTDPVTPTGTDASTEAEVATTPDTATTTDTYNKADNLTYRPGHVIRRVRRKYWINSNDYTNLVRF